MTNSLQCLFELIDKAPRLSQIIVAISGTFLAVAAIWRLIHEIKVYDFQRKQNTSTYTTLEPEELRVIMNDARLLKIHSDLVKGHWLFKLTGKWVEPDCYDILTQLLEAGLFSQNKIKRIMAESVIKEGEVIWIGVKVMGTVHNILFYLYATSCIASALTFIAWAKTKNGDAGSMSFAFFTLAVSIFIMSRSSRTDVAYAVRRKIKDGIFKRV